MKGGKHLTLAALRKRNPLVIPRQRGPSTVQQLNRATNINEEHQGVGSGESTRQKKAAWKSWKEKFIMETRWLDGCRWWFVQSKSSQTFLSLNTFDLVVTKTK